MIHTSADFGYADTLTFSENAVEIAKHLIRTGADIVTDTNMALSGVNKKCLRHMVEWRIVLWRTRRLQERQKNAR